MNLQKNYDPSYSSENNGFTISLKFCLNLNFRSFKEKLLEGEIKNNTKLYNRCTDKGGVEMHYDAIVIGAGPAGLTAVCQLIDAQKKVLLVDQEPENSFGGQAFWSFGGLFLVDTPEQRRLGIKDSKELAWQDWRGSLWIRPIRG